jgi:hypothetical protein
MVEGRPETTLPRPSTRSDSLAPHSTWQGAARVVPAGQRGGLRPRAPASIGAVSEEDPPLVTMQFGRSAWRVGGTTASRATSKSNGTRLANPAARVLPMERAAVGEFD